MIAAASGLLAASAAWAARPPAPEEAAGRRIAQRECGACHAVDEGDSPLPEAPPFRLLHRRYPVGGLDQILREGMLAPADPQEEGRPAGHPRMPTVALDIDERDALIAYLRSLEPRLR
jgi:mono/diheme cytochrome c family protein